MALFLQKGQRVIHTPTEAIIEVIEVLPKSFLEAQQVKAKCIKSVITEDIGQIFEYDLDNLEHIQVSFK